MKKSDIKVEEVKNMQVDKEPDFIDDSTSDIAEVNSIQEFIELKKLQNRILSKMLEKLNPTENQNKSNNE
jgi:hypothetical protein